MIQPPWTFPFEQIDTGGDLLLAAAIVVIGTLIPFGLIVAALRHVPAARAAAVATLEPALSALFAFLIHDEALAAVQIAGIAIVLAAVAWVQLQRPDIAAESLGPAHRLITAAAAFRLAWLAVATRRSTPRPRR